MTRLELATLTLATLRERSVAVRGVRSHASSFGATTGQPGQVRSIRPDRRALYYMLEREVSACNASGAAQRIRWAGFSARETLDDFD